MSKKYDTPLQQMLSYQFINKNITLYDILKDINIDGIVSINLNEIEPQDVENSDFWHLWDYDDLPDLMSFYMNLKIMIDRFIEEGLDLTEYTIIEKPAHNVFQVQSNAETGIHMLLKDGAAIPYYVDNHTDLSYNMFKADSIMEAFAKNKL